MEKYILIISFCYTNIKKDMYFWLKLNTQVKHCKQALIKSNIKYKSYKYIDSQDSQHSLHHLLQIYVLFSSI